MIRTEREYEATMKTLAEGERFLEQRRDELVAAGRTPDEVERALAPLLAFHAQARDEVDWYERARHGQVDPVPVAQIGRLLIGLRIARGLTQRQLAERLGTAESVVSRDERNEYHGITVERVERVLSALGASASVEERPRGGGEAELIGSR